MKKPFILPLLTLLLATNTFAQNTTRNNNIHLTLLGHGVFGSIGYNHTLPTRPTLPFKAEAGLSLTFYPTGYDEANWWLLGIFPEFNTVWFKRNHHLELGIIIPFGIEFEQEVIRPAFMIPIPNYRIGWRREAPEGKVFWRAGISSVTYTAEDTYYWPLMPYLGMGIKF